jgi:hypothetical protein
MKENPHPDVQSLREKTSQLDETLREIEQHLDEARGEQKD